MREDLLPQVIELRDNSADLEVYEFIKRRKEEIVTTIGTFVQTQNAGITPTAAAGIAEKALLSHELYHRLIGSTPSDVSIEALKGEAEKIAGADLMNQCIDQAAAAIDQLLVDIVGGIGQ